MTRTLFTFTLMTVLATAQDVSPVATQQDLRQLKTDMQKQNKAGDDAILQAIGDSRSVETTEYVATDKAIGKIADGQGKIAEKIDQDNVNTVNAVIDSNKKTQQKVDKLTWLVAGVFGALVIIAIRSLRTRKGRNAETLTTRPEPQEIPVRVLQMPAPTMMKLPDDPTETQVEEFSKLTGLDSFPGSIRLPLQNDVLVVGATFRKDTKSGGWLVDFPGIPTRTFGNRRKSAQDFFLASKNSSEAGQQEMVS